MSGIFQSQRTYEELWEIVSITPNGKEKDILLLCLLIKAPNTEALWDIYWATGDEGIQELVLGRIVVATDCIEEIKRVLQYASSRVELLANVKFDLFALERLVQLDTTNETRLVIAYDSPSYECRIHALESVLKHTPTQEELWSVFNHPNCTGDLKERIWQTFEQIAYTELTT